MVTKYLGLNFEVDDLILGLEKLLGENYIIKGYKKNEVTLSSNKKKLNAWEVLTDTYKNYK